MSSSSQVNSNEIDIIILIYSSGCVIKEFVVVVVVCLWVS